MCARSTESLPGRNTITDPECVGWHTLDLNNKVGNLYTAGKTSLCTILENMVLFCFIFYFLWQYDSVHLLFSWRYFAPLTQVYQLPTTFEMLAALMLTWITCALLHIFKRLGSMKQDSLSRCQGKLMPLRIDE